MVNELIPLREHGEVVQQEHAPENLGLNDIDLLVPALSTEQGFRDPERKSHPLHELFTEPHARHAGRTSTKL